MTEPAIVDHAHVRNLFDQIKTLKRKGYGYEDIAVMLDINWRHIRPFVITKKGGK